MKHYSRENERAQDQIAELEKCRNVLEANVAAIGACWELVGLSTQKFLIRDTETTSADSRSQFAS